MARCGACAAMEKIGMARRRMDDLALIELKFTTQVEQLSNAKFLLEDVVFAIRDFADKITYSPVRLQALDDRLNSLGRLKRKYGGTLLVVSDHLAKMKGKQDELQHNEEHEQSLLKRLEIALQAYRKAAMDLTRHRQSAAKKLEAQLKKDLSDVALEKSQFIVNFNLVTASGAMLQIRQELAAHFQEIGFSRLGNETVEFYFTANKGEEARAMSAVASGGELSRLMLILKTNIAPSPYPRTLVFDEIDAGIGGRVAEAVGLRLKKLAKSNQVICVTHQAQIARYADIHLQVTKEVKGQRTVTRIAKLEGEDRIQELGRMIAGANLTKVTLEHAKELLQYS